MRTFDETKTFEMESPDLERGYLQRDRLLKEHHEEVPEKVLKTAEEIAKELECEGKEITRDDDGNLYYTLQYNPKTDGREVKRIYPEMQEHIPAWDEFEEIQVYIPYSKRQYAQRQIDGYKRKLAESDYKALKYFEGYLSEDEYAPIKNERQSWRDKINELEEKLKNIEE